MGWIRVAVAPGITMGVLLGCLVIYQVSVELPSGWVRRLSEPLMEMRRWLFWRGELYWWGMHVVFWTWMALTLWRSGTERRRHESPVAELPRG